MSCFLCKGKMEQSTTTHFVELEHCMVIIKNVPCFKCSQCGEVAYTATVAERIEQIIAGVEKAMTEIAAINYTAA